MRTYYDNLWSDFETRGLCLKLELNEVVICGIGISNDEIALFGFAIGIQF
jgi:hypothetical protein